MYVSPDTLRFLLELGLGGDKLVELFQRLEEDAGMGASKADIPSADLQALERRRAKDRERKQRVRGHSADISADISADAPFPPPPSPQTPQPPPPIPARENTTRERADDGFERFWAAYPRKVAKPDARRAYPKAIARIASPDPCGVLIAALDRMRPDWCDPRFIPHPSTWLNREGWNDEPVLAPIITPLRPTHGTDRQNAKLAARHDNLTGSFAGSEDAAELWRRTQRG